MDEEHGLIRDEDSPAQGCHDGPVDDEDRPKVDDGGPIYGGAATGGVKSRKGPRQAADGQRRSCCWLNFFWILGN